MGLEPNTVQCADIQKEIEVYKRLNGNFQLVPDLQSASNKVLLKSIHLGELLMMYKIIGVEVIQQNTKILLKLKAQE